MLTPGTILQGRYRIIRWLGGGGMGAVYLAADQRLVGRQVAVKQLVPDPGASPADVAQTERQFQAEAALLATLDHPNLPKVFDCFTEAGQSYLVMEYVNGETMEAILERTAGPLPESSVLAWAAQVCDVLSYLHGCQPPIIFRDLKPGNIMLDRQGAVKLIDFGIARIFKPGKQTDTLRMGTLGYAPPEQYAGQGQTDARSDLYSLGATLHHLLTGRDPALYPPFSFNTVSMRSLNPAISTRTEGAVMKALAYNPADRFPSAADFKRTLLGTGASLQVPTVHVGSQRRFPVVVAVALLAIAVTVTGIVMVRSGTGTATPAPLSPRPTTAVSMVTALPAPTLTPAPAVELPTSTAQLPAPTAVLPPTLTPEPPPTPTPEPPPTSPPTPAPALPDDVLGKIAFYSNRDGNDEIYIMDGDGAYQRRVTYNAASDVYPALSPDSRRIAFVSDRDGNPEIYVINVDGSGETRLTYDAGEDRLPMWSPDGSRIAFNSDRSGNLDLYIMDADAGRLTQVTFDPARDGHATWSPDGRRLAFNSGMTKDAWEIYVMPAAGGEWRRLTDNAVMDWSPNWSPVDDRIVYLAWRSSKTVIAVIDADGRDQRDLLIGLSEPWAASWSPDGQRIIFTSTQSGRDEIYVMSADGVDIRQLTYDGAAYPSWSR